MNERIDKCPDCNCDVIQHNSERFYAWHYNPVGSQTKCTCTRTYESLVGEKQECEQRKHEDKMKRMVEMQSADLSQCPCRIWATTDMDFVRNFDYQHHPNCDGHGKPKTHFVTGLSVAEPELQLLVIDLGDSCVVKVEKGEFKWTVAHTFNVDKSVMLSGHTFAKLKEAIDGVKPLPRIEQCGQEDFIMLYGTKGMHLTITAQQYKSLTEINGGKPLPIWTGEGKWECLNEKVDALPTIWRYTR